MLRAGPGIWALFFTNMPTRLITFVFALGASLSGCAWEDGPASDEATPTEQVAVALAGDPCTTNAQCDDGNKCTVDKCVQRKCAYTNKADGTACNDGNACTLADSCSAGQCVGGPPVICAPPNQCQTANGCNPGSGKCVYVSKAGAACDDGNTCTQGDQCTSSAAGVCKGTRRPNRSVCDDGNASTVGDVCTAGACAGVDHCVGVTCAATDQCHVAGTCVDHATGACSNPSKPEGTACTGPGGAALICSAGQCTHTAVAVDAEIAASWIKSDSGSPMAVLTDGRVLVWSSHNLYALATGVATPAPLVWPSDATVNGGSTYYGSPGGQIVVWATPADGDYIYSSGENKHTFRADGTHAWSWLGPGCCDYVQNAAYDPVRDHLLNSTTYNALAVLNANTGSVLTLYQPIIPAYQAHYYSVAGDKVFHVGGSDHIVAQQSLVDGSVDWSVNFSGVLAGGSLLHGAVAGDGTIVVGSSGEHGRIMRLNADGTVHFSVENGTSTAPVVSETAIYVGSAIGTSYALQSYGFEGDLRWSIPVAGPPTSLLVGDDGVVFASIGGSAGEIVGARESDGTMAVHFVNVEGGGELMLRAGKLLLKSANHLYALPVGASNYPAKAPWPVQLHDNLRSSARAVFAPMVPTVTATGARAPSRQ